MKKLLEQCGTAEEMFAALWQAGRHDILLHLPRIDRDEFAPAQFKAEVLYRVGEMDYFTGRRFTFGKSGTLYLEEEAFTVVAGRHLPPEQGYPIGVWYVIVQHRGNYFLLGLLNQNVYRVEWAGTSLSMAQILLSSRCRLDGKYEDFLQWYRNNNSMLKEEN